MNRLQIFNHHSLPFDSEEKARDTVPQFLKICLKAKRLGFDTILLDDSQDPSWFRLELAPGYFFQDWHDKTGSRGEDRENLRAFRTIATKTPLFSIEDIGGDLALFEAKEKASGKDYCALTAAAWYRTHISSFATREPWNQSPIAVTVTQLDEDGMHRRDAEIVNWYALAVIDQMESVLRAERDAAIRSGGDIWNEKEALYPMLSFCARTT